jgi:hypothetical protein
MQDIYAFSGNWWLARVPRTRRAQAPAARASAEGAGAAWTEEREARNERPSDEGRRCLGAPGAERASTAERANTGGLTLLAVGVDGAAGGDGAGAAAGVDLGVEDGAGHAGGYGFYQVFCPGGIGVIG